MAKITYEDKEFLNKNENIADKNKVNDTDLNEIKEVVNENDDNVGDLSSLNTTDKTSLVNAVNEIENRDIYSTTETKIGTWINGKAIYRKVIDLGAFKFIKGNKDISIPNTPVDTLVSGKWCFKNKNKWYFEFSSINNFQWINDTTLYYDGVESFTCQQMYVILEYTKSTE